ncbi:MAG: hypothetical protein JW737_09365 [Acidobacteria bacterium]|nr:hypothetical protein [Acidobacteriota bacterium]
MRIKLLFSIMLVLFISTKCLFSDTTFVSGNVSGEWERSESPYMVTGDIIVNTDSCLRIAPGCSIIFMGYYKLHIDNNAVFKAIGTETDSIVFTALDTHLTDTSGGFASLTFDNESEACTLAYCNIEFGRGEYGGAINCTGSKLVLNNNTIINNLATRLGAAIWLCISHCVIMNNSIYNNHSNSSGGGICFFAYDSSEVMMNDIYNNSADRYGGGIYCQCSYAIIENNDIHDNHAERAGGGICFEDEDNFDTYSRLINNRIINNTADEGGGIFCYDAWPDIFDNLIKRNQAVKGGGVYFDFDVHAIVINNDIIENTVTDFGGGIYVFDDSYWYGTIKGNRISHNEAGIDGGGVYYNWIGAYSLESNVISHNRAARNGGGLFLGGSFEMDVINNIFYSNRANANGGGVHCVGSALYFMNNCFVKNYSELNGGGISITSSLISLINNIFWEDSASMCPEVYFSSTIPCSLYFVNNCIDSNSVCVEGESSFVDWRSGNISEDPLFLDTLFHLSEASPCIDAGAESLLYNLDYTTYYPIWAPEEDIEGNPRPFGGGFEIGAYEYSDPLLYQNLHYGWNLVSLQRVTPVCASELFEFSPFHAFGYSTDTRTYHLKDTLEIGVGYWILSDRDTMISNANSRFNSYTRVLYPGWNLIGGLSLQVSTSTLDTISGIVTSPFGYNTLEHCYFIADTFFPGFGYWILVNDTIEFNLNLAE